MTIETPHLTHTVCQSICNTTNLYVLAKTFWEKITAFLYTHFNINYLTFHKAKQINILGSRQHPAETVALWCEFFIIFFFKRGQIAGYSYTYKYVFNGV